MAHLNVSLDFDSASETATGNGWRVIHWLTDEVATEPVEPTENHYATITAAQGAIEELFSSDVEVDKFFYDKAVATTVAGQAGPIATAKSSLRTAEGLDPTP